MSADFIKSKITTLGCLIKVTGPSFEKAEEVAVLLGIESIRIVAQVLKKNLTLPLQRKRQECFKITVKGELSLTRGIRFQICLFHQI